MVVPFYCGAYEEIHARDLSMVSEANVMIMYFFCH